MLTNLEKAYIAGFLDGDGCVMFQLVRRKDYIFGYQVRASIVFYQKTKHRSHLEWLKTKFHDGYIRDRSDEMSEYTIVGIPPVKRVLTLLRPYLRLKQKHALLALKIIRQLPKRFASKQLLVVAKLVDQFIQLNYSKKRKNTTKTLRAFFRTNHVSP